MFLLLQLSANLRMTGGIEDHCNQDINKSSKHTQWILNVEQPVEVILIAGNENQHEDQVKVASGAGMFLIARAHSSAHHSPDTETNKRDVRLKSGKGGGVRTLNTKLPAYTRLLSLSWSKWIHLNLLAHILAFFRHRNHARQGPACTRQRISSCWNEILWLGVPCIVILVPCRRRGGLVSLSLDTKM